jgi:FecR protein
LQLETGDKLRTKEYSFVELTVLPDMFLRLNGDSEVLFEQLANESISIKLLRGSAILDIARFDRKQVPQIKFAGPTTSVVVADEGNYRLNVTSSGDQVVVRDGKVIFKDREVGDCRQISVETVSDCDKRRYDNFDFWSEHRGEGNLYNGRAYVSMVSVLGRIRSARFRNTGFWFQDPGKTHYIFVPFTATHFRSPYGGNYSTVLTPRRPVLRRIFLGSGTLGLPPLISRP